MYLIDLPALEKVERLRRTGTPTWVYVVVCDNCSHRCSWCYGGFDGDLSHFMSHEEFETILEKMASVGVTQSPRKPKAAPITV